MSAAVVANGGRVFADACQEFFHGFFLHFCAFHCRVQVGNVGLVVPVVVDFHGERVEVWLERVVVVGKGI